MNRGGKRVKQKRSDRRVQGEHKPPHTTIPTHSPLVISRYLWNRGSDRLTEPHTTTCSPSAARNRTTEARFGIVLPNPSPPRVFEMHHPTPPPPHAHHTPPPLFTIPHHFQRHTRNRAPRGSISGFWPQITHLRAPLV